MAEKHRPRPLKRGAALREMGERVQGGAGENLALGHGGALAEVGYRLQPHLRTLLAANFNDSIEYQVESGWRFAGAEQNPARRMHINSSQPDQQHLFLQGHAVEERALPDCPQQIFK